MEGMRILSGKLGAKAKDRNILGEKLCQSSIISTVGKLVCWSVGQYILCSAYYPPFLPVFGFIIKRDIGLRLTKTPVP